MSEDTTTTNEQPHSLYLLRDEIRTSLEHSYQLGSRQELPHNLMVAYNRRELLLTTGENLNNQNLRETRQKERRT